MFRFNKTHCTVNQNLWYYLLRHNEVWLGRIAPTFRRDSKSVMVLFAACFLLALIFFLMLEEVCSSETSVKLYRSTRHYVIDYNIFHSLSCENQNRIYFCVLNSRNFRVREWRIYLYALYNWAYATCSQIVSSGILIVLGLYRVFQRLMA